MPKLSRGQFTWHNQTDSQFSTENSSDAFAWWFHCRGADETTSPCDWIDEQPIRGREHVMQAAREPAEQLEVRILRYRYIQPFTPSSICINGPSPFQTPKSFFSLVDTRNPLSGTSGDSFCLFVFVCFHPQEPPDASLYFLQPETIIESVSDGRLPWHHTPFTHAGESHGRLEQR